jgi:hypothetical protein
MSEVDPDSSPPGERVLTGLFWAGVGLMPLAGLVLLLGGEGGAVRVAAFLTVLAVVLIGLSITLRPDASAVRTEMEEMLLEEIDMLREDVRDDITTAARATHQAFEERMQFLQQTIDALRAEVEMLRSAGPLLGHPVPMAHPGPPPPPGAPPTASRHHQPAMAAASVPVPAGGPPPPAHGGGETYASANAERHSTAAGRAHVPTGIVRHTETVHHVTTRSTFVDRQGEDDGYHARAADQASSPPSWAGAQRPTPTPAPEEEEESWTDRMLRERYGRTAERGDPVGERRGGRRRRRDEDGDSGRLPDGQRPVAGDQDRWASVHSDDRAAELRMGERRAAMRSAEGGTEVRIEDRWAAVRREWDRDDRDDRRDRPEPAADRWEWDRDRDLPRAERRGGRREMRALPPGDDLPSWNAQWDEPDREPGGHRHRAADDSYSSGRRFEFELSDERWR